MRDGRARTCYEQFQAFNHEDIVVSKGQGSSALSGLVVFVAAHLSLSHVRALRSHVGLALRNRAASS